MRGEDRILHSVGVSMDISGTAHLKIKNY